MLFSHSKWGQKLVNSGIAAVELIDVIDTYRRRVI